MVSIVGWKDILRPIRDGYRHLYPSPDTGPTPEERERQRAQDALRGFTYFDTFSQLESWSEDASDAIQRANTPLLERPGQVKDGEGKATVLLCHDYAGNYHDYENIQQVGIDEERYSCEYLQLVDTFVYFSHKLACIPPPSWTNTLHRNGVKVLGTLLVEPQTKEIEKLVEYRDGQRGQIDFPMAKKLADLSLHYGFDGWLVNIEKSFPREHWSSETLKLFLSQLTEELGADRQLLWYDALTVNNKISYQNALTTQNLPFAEASEGMLTNYCWKESDAWASKDAAPGQRLSPKDLFFGVDVWAQNYTTNFAYPRVTFPGKGGGGTNTGVAVAKLAEIGLSVGIFAPAWSFEHFPGHGRELERAIWNGFEVPNAITCSCGDANARHTANRRFPVARFAKLFAAGSRNFFYTDFTRAFGKHGAQESDLVYGGKRMHSQLTAQSLLPHTSICSAEDMRGANNILSHRLEDLIGRTELIVEAQGAVNPTDDSAVGWLSLFNLDMPADGSLHLAISMKFLLQHTEATVSFYLSYSAGTELLPITKYGGLQKIEAILGAETAATPNRLLQLGLHLEGPRLNHIKEQILRILEIRIGPTDAPLLQTSCSIENIRIEARGERQTRHWRVCWSYQDEGNGCGMFPGFPYSKITGPFSYFAIVVDGIHLGRAYALEYMLGGLLAERLRGNGADVSISGISFDGRQLAASHASLRI